MQGKARYLMLRRGRPRAAPLAAAAGGWRRREAAAPSSASPAARPPAPTAARRGARTCPAWRAARGQRRHIAGGRRSSPHPQPRRRLCGGSARPPTDVPGRSWGGAERGHRLQGPEAAYLRAWPASPAGRGWCSSEPALPLPGVGGSVPHSQVCQPRGTWAVLLRAGTTAARGRGQRLSEPALPSPGSGTVSPQIWPRSRRPPHLLPALPERLPGPRWPGQHPAESVSLTQNHRMEWAGKDLRGHRVHAVTQRHRVNPTMALSGFP